MDQILITYLMSIDLANRVETFSKQNTKETCRIWTCHRRQIVSVEINKMMGYTENI